MIRRVRTATGANHFMVVGRESIQLECHTANGAEVKVSIQVGGIGVDGREYFAIDVVHDPATDITFDRDMPQSVRTIGRLPKHSTPMGIMDSSDDWKVGKTKFKQPQKGKRK